ncbi:MAG: FAD-dependent thymidylate synthase [Clostridia bacterium]|nr:FAD-dependent thymidylate synthase [Clostridia bacterium]
MLKVILISHTPNPEKIVASAAKMCYSNSGAENILDKLDEEKTTKFLEHLTSLGHESPLEHITFTFAVEGGSRSLLAQLTRHRMASYSVKSQRYVEEADFEFVTPPEIAENADAKALYEETMAKIGEAYEKLTEVLYQKHVLTMDEKSAKKKAIEDARFVLPNACETKLIMTFNARSLLNFFQHRCCNRAQWEIQALADAILWKVREVAPTIFAKAGPKCVSGACPEGAMSCGKRKQMQERYLAK